MRLSELIAHLTTLHNALGEAEVVVQQRAAYSNDEPLLRDLIGITHHLVLPVNPTSTIRLDPGEKYVPPAPVQQVVIVYHENAR